MSVSKIFSKIFYGLDESARSWLLSTITRSSKSQLILCKDSKEIETLSRELSFFLGSSNKVLPFPPWDTLPFEHLSPQADVLAQRILVLNSLLNRKINKEIDKESSIVISCPDAVMQRVISPRILSSLTFSLTKDLKISREEIESKLTLSGYRFVTIVEEIGDAAIRGNVVDIFTPLHSQPLRCEFISDKIDSLRLFNPESQRSNQSITTATILPIREFSGQIVSKDEDNALQSVIENLKKHASSLQVPPRELDRLLYAIKEKIFLPGLEQFLGHIYDDTQSLFDYIDPSATIQILNRINIENSAEKFTELVTERYQRFFEESHLIADPKTLYLSTDEFLSKLQTFNKNYIEPIEALDLKEESVPSEKISVITHSELSTKLKAKVGTGDALAPLIESISEWRSKGYKIAFIVGSNNRAKRLQNILLRHEILPEILPTSGLDWSEDPNIPSLVILNGELNHGFRLPNQKLAFISESEIFAERSHRHTPSKVRSVKKFMSALAQLKDGDFIVHIDYGVGLYHGLSHLVVDKKGRDFLHIEYAGGTKLYLPVENIGKIQKFVSKEGTKPALDKLGSPKWEKKKAKVRQAVIALAGELITLYATRKNLRGWRFDSYGAEDERFSDGFGFEETPDQLKAIQDTISDMSSDRPMDRLVCGDAGFGKTEVALRAAFKCIQHGRQVALLVPTTILAEQHFSVFKNRFIEYPVKVSPLSRFYNHKTNAETLSNLANGSVDIVIGTHKLLQPNVEFKDLGLLIIDEEHRFGVKHKERLKQLKKNVDVLTLTATPIPRTLHMALLGIREISIITTPPHDRRVIRTYISTHDENLVRDAVIRELQRGGQCFILHNKVQNIGTITKELSDHIPEARFDYAHGQMHESQLEKVMLKFIKQEIDVLVCTTIIESGLDIPNANTIVINRADQLGLAQLYQLRGRVGRSNKQAYAYLMVPEFKKLGDDAKKRLQVLQSLDDLGLGFNLAARDLEIRGAGNILGKDQSGNVQSVGLDLYNRILKEAILNLRGEEVDLSDVIDPELRISIDAFIPPDYIPDIPERLILYQRLAEISSNQEAWDLNFEIEDRFGQLPSSVYNLVQLMRLRSLLKISGITKIEVINEKITVTFSPKAKVNDQAVISLINSYPDQYKHKGKLSFSIISSEIKSDETGTIIDTCYEFVKKVLLPTPIW